MRGPERTVRRIARAGLWLLVMVPLAAALLPGSAASAYDPQTALLTADQDPTTLGAPEIQVAPQRPLDPVPFPPGTGFIPPSMDLSHLNGQRMPGAAAPQALPSAWDWRDMGMVTPVRDQGSCGSCYAFGSLANFESKMLLDGAGTFNFSENHAKECNWRELNNYQSPDPGDYWGSCDGGNSYMLASLFSQTGTVHESCAPYVASDVGCTSSCPYEKTLLDWRIISAGTMPDPEVLKQYIYDHGPVTASMYADSSEGYDNTYDGSDTFDYTTPGDSTNHSVMIVGWSNDLPSVPGGTGPADGWIVKNSWGTGWGDGGYFYVTYGAANMGIYASYVHAWQDYDTGGDIWYYDDDGWSTRYGYGTTTAWALSRFIPNDNTYATRVEFWTSDATTDLDVYLYDDFDGVTRSNLLASELNRSFSEAGYHSVALASPLPLTSGDDIIVVVKFTNLVDTYPIAADSHGTIETGRTYLSSSGSGWIDMGAMYDTDLAVRLRTSAGFDATVSLTKSMINDDGGTSSEADFQPYIDGSPVSWDTPQSLSPGTHLVSETWSAGYSASDWGGDCETDGTLVVAPGGAYTCAITNNDIAPSVTLTKAVVNDDGGTRVETDFQAYLDGDPVSWEAPITVLSGTHTVSEDPAQGYAASAWGGDCETDGTLTAEVGGQYTCSVTNDDIAASLILTKTVSNDGGGTLSKDDFQPYLDSEPLSWDTPVALSAGAHTVSETCVSGYSASSWGGDCAGDGALTVELGGTYTCTITNDDISPTLTLTKTVVSDDGGTLSEGDFQPFLDGSPVSWDTTMPLEPGTHTISETEGTGYQASAWGGDCAAAGTLTAAIGGTYTCTVTNNDVAPALTLTKTVVNNHGGTLSSLDFPATIGSSPATWGVRHELAAGTYLVTEDQQPGYTASPWNGHCTPSGTVSLAIGDEKACHITNTDVAPMVTLTKTVVNNDGGTLSEDDFHPYVDGIPASWEEPVTLISGTHSVSESLVSGYAASSWGGDCAATGVLTAMVGGVYTCTVTNDDIGPIVTLAKTVINDDGGSLTQDDFLPYAGGDPVSWDTPVSLQPGTHTVSETQVAGYAASIWGGDCADDGSLTVEVGGAYTCTVTNDDIAASVTVTKMVVSNDGGSLTQDDFHPYLDGDPVSWDTPVPLEPGTHTVSETEAFGYAASTWGGDCAEDGSLTAELAGVYTCSITNDDMAPTVTLSKTVVNNDGGTLSQDSFQPYLDGDPVSWDVPVPLSPGTHTVSETQALGYAASAWGGDCAQDGSLTAQVGGTYTCTITNDDASPTVSLTKAVLNDDGGSLTEDDFQPYLDDSPVSWDTPLLLSLGTHTVSETQVAGYEASTWGGDCADDGSLTAAPGGIYTCTITNDDLAPTVALTKTVVNDDGGTLLQDSFQPYLDGDPVSWDMPLLLSPGPHAVSETEVLGYAASDWGGDCAENGVLIVDMGGTYTCTITNDDIGPTVTLIKTVINDDGGSLSEGNFQPFLDGSPVAWDTAVAVLSGTHTVSETQVAGYGASSWRGDCTQDGTLTAQVGGVYTCTITNNDVSPTVTLTKTVVNDDGGSLVKGDFQPFFDGNPESWDTPLPLLPGTHTVSETLLSGYEASTWGGDCADDGALTAVLGVTYTCTITNDDIATTVTLTKTVINDDGGSLTEDDFQPYLNGSPMPWNVPLPLSPGTHTVSETQALGYASSAWGGDCAQDGLLTAQVGGTYTCTITNDDISPTVMLTKTVTNDDGGFLTQDSFQPYLDGTPVWWDTALPLSPGTHAVSEIQVQGYTSSGWSGHCTLEGSLAVEVGGTYTCTITNDDISPTFTLTKTVVNDSGGTLSEDDFQPYLDGGLVSWDTTMPLEPGAHTISETEGTGYQASAWGGDCASDGTLTAAIGGTYACTVTNDDVAPALTLTKSVVNNYGGTLTELDFPATIGSSAAEWGVRYELGPGSYLVKEDLQQGYAASSWNGDCTPNGAVSLEIGDEKTCHITNYDVAPTVTLTKTVVNNDGGTLSEDDFHPYVDGSQVPWGVSATLISGTHSVSETQAVGYAASGWAGDCEADGTLRAQVGGVYTCSVTNDDTYEAPVVMLSKTVSNDDGGASTEDGFQPYLDGDPVSWDVPVAVLSGTHTVSETQMLGYTASAWGGDCEPDGELTALPAGVYTCTVTNYDIAPTLTLTKTVVNDDGGTLSGDSFQPYVNGTRVAWGAPVTLLAGRHTVSETQALGYVASAWGGDCEASGTLTADVGGVYTCAVTNSDVAPTVTLSKAMVNDDGGTLLEDDFQPYIDGTTASWNTPVVVLSGTHTVSETEATGYAASSWGGDCGADGTLTVELGGAYACSLTNDDRAGSVTLIKTVVNDNGGALSEGDFHPYIDSRPVSWDVPVPLAAGTCTISETEIPGYAPSSWDGDCAEDGSLVVDLGGVYTCTVTNNDIGPTVILTKTVLNDNGGTLDKSDFQPYLNGSPVSWDLTVPLVPGPHTVSETQVPGYAASAWGGDCTNGGSLTAVLGGAYICTVTNDDIGPAVTSITPSSGVNTDTVRIAVLAGSNFQPGATVALVKADQPSLPGTGIHVESAAKITCDLNLNGTATGRWSVVVTNPDSRVGVLPGGFMVYPPGGPWLVYLPLVMRR